ncbi:MAG: chloramphenicol acetyltransferase, partial [Candidatus Heimdallarchaeota archaeon]
MRYIDMQTWPRRDHFRLFSTFNHPHFSMCVNVDLTAFLPVVKQRGYSLTVTIAYIITRASNTIPEFRYRIRGDQVVEHEIVNPSFTILVNEDLFSFCTVDYIEDFPVFAARAAKNIASVKKHTVLDDEPERDDYLFMSTIPWVSFTSFTHPMQLHPADSIPRFAWGKIFEEGGLLKMPLGVQGHHAVMDGIHMGRFYEKVQSYFHQPED